MVSSVTVSAAKSKPSNGSGVAVIMAAGKSTRMKSVLPKAVHKVCGKEITRHIVDACLRAGFGRVIVVVGHEAETVQRVIGSDVEYVMQTEQRGTGHAAMQAVPLLSEETETVAVLPGDAPLIKPDTLADLLRRHTDSGAAATLLTAKMANPPPYGRILRFADGRVDRIVEAKDATDEQLKIDEVGVSIYAFKAAALVDGLKSLRPDNAQREYYLTDVIGALSSRGEYVDTVVVDDPLEVMGINTRVELAEVAAAMRLRILRELMLSGVTIVDPATTYIDVDVEIGRDTVIHPCTVIERGCRIGESCSVGPFVRLRQFAVGNNATVDSVPLLAPKGDTR